MAIRLILGAPQSGKTEYALNLVQSHIEQNDALSLSSVRLIAPSNAMASELRKKLTTKLNRPSIIGYPVTTFYNLADELLLEHASKDRLLTDFQKEIVLRQLSQSNQLTYFQKNAELSGFSKSIGKFIDELTIASVTPETFQSAVDSISNSISSNNLIKLNEASLLYKQYIDYLLKFNYHDREGIMSRTNQLLKDIDLSKTLQHVIFDGFSNLTGVMFNFISLLIANNIDITITLRWEKEREEVYQRVNAIREYFVKLGAVEEIINNNSHNSYKDNIILSLFNKSITKHKADDSIIIMSSGSPALQWEQIANEIIKLIRSGKADFSQIAVCNRTNPLWKLKLYHLFRKYGIPCEHPEEIAANSNLGKFLLLSLKICQRGWQKPDVFRLLKSPYLSQNNDEYEAICEMQITAAKRGLSNNRSIWFEAWLKEDPNLDFRVKTLADLAEFDDQIKAASDIKGWTNALILYLEKYKTRTVNSPHFIDDLAVYQTVNTLLNEIANLTPAVNRRMDFDSFVEMISLGLRSSKVKKRKTERDGVTLIDPESLRQQKYKIVFLTDMLEKIFPRIDQEDALLLDNERQLINKLLPQESQLKRSDQITERYLFLDCLTAGEKIYISYPSVDDNARDSLPSFYIDDIMRRTEDEPIKLDRPISNLILPLNRTETTNDFLISLAHARTHSDADPNELNAIINAMPANVNAVFSAKWTAFDDKPAALISDKALHLFSPEKKTYRCTEIETYASCPFQYYCSQQLKLKELPSEIGAMEEGNYLHNALNSLFIELRAKNKHPFNISQLNFDDIMSAAVIYLNCEFDKDGLNKNMPEHQRELTIKRLTKTLELALKFEFNNPLNDFTPTYFELSFGAPLNNDRPSDPASITEPLILEKDGIRVKLCGKLDRVDISPQGALVMDYKRSKREIKDVVKGFAYQPALYCSALLQLFNIHPAGTEYRPITKDKPSGIYNGEYANYIKIKEKNSALNDVIAQCEQSAVELISMISKGEIPVKPSRKKSCDFCKFEGICRIDEYKKLQMEENQAETGGDE